MEYYKDYQKYTGKDPQKFYKSSLFQSPRMLLGLNCLEPGQTQDSHKHTDQDKFYFVIDGEGEFTVEHETYRAGPGWVVWAPAGKDHGVKNTSDQRLVVLVGIAPSP